MPRTCVSKIQNDLASASVSVKPAAGAVDAPAPGDEKKEPEQSTSGVTVLVVDEDPELGEVMTSMLKALRYDAMAAGTSAQALEILAEDGRIDLMIVEVAMRRGMNGWQLAREARRLRPDLKVLYMSGSWDEDVSGDGAAEPKPHLLTKPFRMAELGQAVRRALLDGPET